MYVAGRKLALHRLWTYLKSSKTESDLVRGRNSVSILGFAPNVWDLLEPSLCQLTKSSKIQDMIDGFTTSHRVAYRINVSNPVPLIDQQNSQITRASPLNY